MITLVGFGVFIFLVISDRIVGRVINNDKKQCDKRKRNI